VSAPLVVIAGSVAQKPQHGGHTWQFLQYLLGFRRLGWEVLLLDAVEPDQGDPQAAARFLERTWSRAGLDRRWALAAPDGDWFGMGRDEVMDAVRSSRLLINVMGFLRDEQVLDAAPRRVFLDTDPGFPQMWADLGLHDSFEGHDAFVTIGERIGRSDCTIPLCGRDWITTPQPIALESWPAVGGAAARFTGVASWRGAYGPVDHGGVTYGLRVHEHRRFARLPAATGLPFELALDIHRADERDRLLLEDGRWRLVDPRVVAGDPWSYRRYVQGSGAELAVAKGMYVQSRSGWFSERSICYLASGKPVVAHDTGFAELVDTGAGLLAFRTFDEAVAAVEEVARDPEGHGRAARALAEKHFAAERVLPRLLERLEISTERRPPSQARAAAERSPVR
jgi:hypothetical protein